MRVLVFSLCYALFVSGCASGPNPSGSTDWVASAVAGDGPGRWAPAAAPEPLKVENLPKSRRGNPSEYTVDGVRYAVMDSAEGYAAEGLASWYGRKFHGRETSSGELYDMYQLTAAHKHLPLPTFVRVTRVDTGKSIVVKVNDRGPFVSGRVIDLSYQAAASLGIVKDGTASVLVEALSSHRPQTTTVSAATEAEPQTGTETQTGTEPLAGTETQTGTEPLTGAESLAGTEPAASAEPVIIEVPASAQVSPQAAQNVTAENYLQLGAFIDESNAERLALGLVDSLPYPIVVNHNPIQSLFRVWVGPINSIAEQDQAVAALRAQGVSQFSMVTSTHIKPPNL